MKRGDVIRKIRKAAKAQGVNCELVELTRHTGIHCGDVRTTIGRHNEIPDHMAETIFKQLEPALGNRWWK
jgi:mRNA interferase HicA